MSDHVIYGLYLITGIALNIFTYTAMIRKLRKEEERRAKKNLLADGENSYKFECMWSDYKKSHNIHSQNGGNHGR